MLRNRKAIMEKVWEGTELFEAGDGWVAGWRNHCVQEAGKSTHWRVAMQAEKVGAPVKEQTLDTAGENMTLTKIQDMLPFHSQSTHLKAPTPSAFATISCTCSFSIRNTNQTPNPIVSLMSQAVGTAEYVNLFLRSQGTGRSQQNKTVKHLPEVIITNILTWTNCLWESE